MKFLKTVEARHAGYTGVLGRVMFKDGVSVEMVPQHIRDRMAASFPFVEIDAEGNEQPAGSIFRMSSAVEKVVEVAEGFARQTEEDKARELLEARLAAQKVPDLETRESLEAIADKKGIAGIREIAAKWNVKHRSINVLIEMVLEAQRKFLANRQALVNRPGVVTGEIEPTQFDQEPEGVKDKPEQEPAKDPEMTDAQKAAAAGDMGAALSTDETLLGSSAYAATYEIKGETVQLGDLVAAAHLRSGSTVAEWNGLPDADRDDLIRLELDRRLAE